MASQKVLVTGAAGFIGSRVVEALLDRGDKVTAIDNFDPYYGIEVKRRNIAAAMGHDGYNFVEGDIRDHLLIDELVSAGNFDVIIHLAAKAGVRPSILDPVGYDSVNVIGTSTILEAIRKYNVPHLVAASSSSVYGATSKSPFSERESADRPSSPYAATKRANELATYAHHHLYGTTVSCLRFFTVYGPRQRPEMAIHKFTRLIDEGQPVPMFGDGSSSRDYTFIDDIVTGVVAAADRPRGYRIYNLGTTGTIALSLLIQEIGARLGKDPVVDQQPFQNGDVPFTHADISLAAAELDYAPTTSIYEGLDLFIEWYLREKEESLQTYAHLTGTGHAMAAVSETVERVGQAS